MRQAVHCLRGEEPGPEVPPHKPAPRPEQKCLIRYVWRANPVGPGSRRKVPGHARVSAKQSVQKRSNPIQNRKRGDEEERSSTLARRAGCVRACVRIGRQAGSLWVGGWVGWSWVGWLGACAPTYLPLVG